MTLQGCILGLFFLGLAFVNISSSPQNNWVIAQLQMLVVLVLVLGPARRVFSLRALAGLGVLGAALLLSNALAAAQGVGLADGRRALEVFVHFVFAVACYAGLRQGLTLLYWALGGMALSAMLYAAVWLGVWFSLEAPRQYDWFHRPPLFTHVRSLGLSLAVLPLVAAWGCLMGRGILRGLLLLSYLASACLLLWSGGRGAMLAMAVGLSVLAIAFAPRHYLGEWLALCSVTALALALSALFHTEQGGIGWWAAWLRSDAALDLEQLSSRRLSMWLYLLERIAQRPWLGWGGEAFQAVWPQPFFVQAHNGLIQMLLEWGIVGAVLVFGAIGYVLLVSGRVLFAGPSRAVRQHLALGFSICLALLVFSMVDGVFYRGGPSALLAFSCALLMAETARQRDERLA